MQEMVTVVCILNPEFAHNAVAQSRDCAALLRNLEIGTQFEDSENALRNLEIAHIPKLRGTYIPLGCILGDLSWLYITCR